MSSAQFKDAPLSVRTSAVAIAYVLCIAASWPLSNLVAELVDYLAPNVFFYHLEPGEEGPLGDAGRAWFGFLIGYLLFLLLFVPIARWLRATNTVLVALAASYLPVILGTIIAIVVTFG